MSDTPNFSEYFMPAEKAALDKIRPEDIKRARLDNFGEITKSHANLGSIEAQGRQPSKRKLADCNSRICRLVRLMRKLAEPKNYKEITLQYQQEYNDYEIDKHAIAKYLSRMVGYAYVSRQPSNEGAELYKLVEGLDVCKCDSEISSASLTTHETK